MNILLGLGLVLLLLASGCAYVWCTAARKSSRKREAGKWTVALIAAIGLLYLLADKH